MGWLEILGQDVNSIWNQVMNDLKQVGGLAGKAVSSIEDLYQAIATFLGDIVGALVAAAHKVYDVTLWVGAFIVVGIAAGIVIMSLIIGTAIKYIMIHPEQVKSIASTAIMFL